MKTKKSKSAITLVALIITIIVLLILATVSISLVINNGLLDKAQNGVDKYSEEEELEQIKLAVASAMLKGNGFLNKENLDSELQERFGEDKETTESSNGWSIKLAKNFNIYKDGNVKESVLPIEYQQVEYIESTGTQWIDTNIKPDNNTYFYIKIKINNKFASANNVAGSRIWNTDNKYGIISFMSSGKFGFFFGEQIYESQLNIDYEIHEFELSKEKFTIDKNEITIPIENDFYVPYNIRIFGFKGDKDDKTNAYKLYQCILKTDNIIRVNFIPCYCTTTVTNVDGDECDSGTIGLYDTVEGKFYTNKGSGTFLKGNNV